MAYRCANEELQYKLSVATDGISTNVLTDKCIQEQHRLELQKLNSSLDAVLSKLDGKVRLALKTDFLSLLIK